MAVKLKNLAALAAAVQPHIYHDVQISTGVLAIRGLSNSECLHILMRFPEVVSNIFGSSKAVDQAIAAEPDNRKGRRTAASKAKAAGTTVEAVQASNDQWHNDVLMSVAPHYLEGLHCLLAASMDAMDDEDAIEMISRLKAKDIQILRKKFSEIQAPEGLEAFILQFVEEMSGHELGDEFLTQAQAA